MSKVVGRQLRLLPPEWRPEVGIVIRDVPNGHVSHTDGAPDERAYLMAIEGEEEPLWFLESETAIFG